jgi:hypothetical protein
MKVVLKILLVIFVLGLTSCRDAKKEEAVDEAVMEQIESVEQETEEIEESIEAEAEELEEALNELDSI